MNDSDLTQITKIVVSGLAKNYCPGQIVNISVVMQIDGICEFDPVLRLFIKSPLGDTHLLGSDTHNEQLFFPWLPRGKYAFCFFWPISLPAGEYQLGVSWGNPGNLRNADFLENFSITEGAQTSSGILNGTWRLQSEALETISKLSWQKGMENWFHRHFCHAALVIGETFLANAPELRGRILDIGAGDGITDLGLFLRYKPQELIAVDIVNHASELPQIARDNDLPLDDVPKGFSFVRGSCENLQYPNESFDLVISWGSVEHIKGGYRKALDEVWRVLRPGGLFFVNPGLFYSEYGSHLGEFSNEPHLHLKISEAELHDLVIGTQPRLMDRAGFDVDNKEYWRFYSELNRIKVADFEAELKAYGYEIIRAAIRANDKIEYTAQLQQYSVLDLAVEDAFFTLRKPLNSGLQEPFLND
ncbi:MAG: methyltransferase domain-containing protein [Pseudomonadota bacterium]